MGKSFDFVDKGVGWRVVKCRYSVVWQRIVECLCVGCCMMSGCHSGEGEQPLSANSERVDALKTSGGEKMSEKRVRPAALAGTWYPRSEEKLRSSIEGYLGAAKGKIEERPNAIVVPHAGHVWSGDVAASGWREVQNRGYKRVFILCPNHRVMLNGVATDDADAFDTPLGAVDVDVETRDMLVKEGIVKVVRTAFNNEHAIEIQLPFMKLAVPEAKLVPLIVGQISEKLAQKLAAKLRELMTADDLLVISSDFLHYGEDYGFVPFEPSEAKIREYDDKTYEAIRWLDGARFEAFAEENDHAACGIHSLRVLTHTFEDAACKVERVDYGTSGRKSGEFVRSVSYQAIVVTGADEGKLREGGKRLSERLSQPSGPVVVLNAEEQSKALALIRMAIDQAVKAGHETPFVPSDIVEKLGTFPRVFEKQYGVFVTLHKDGELRGCIGNIVPYQSLMLGLWGRAQDAAINDPRFEAVTPQELPLLEYEISVLTAPEPISGPEDIVIGRHGVILKKRGHQAIFLPQVAPEQGWNVEQMLNALAVKAGLGKNDWRAGAEFSVIEAQVF